MAACYELTIAEFASDRGQVFAWIGDVAAKRMSR